MNDIRIADTHRVLADSDAPQERQKQVDELTWRGAQEWLCLVVLTWDQATGWYQIDWGDGTVEVAHPDMRARSHGYTTNSACDNLVHTVTVRPLNRDGTTGAVAAEATVYTRGRGNPAHRFSAEGRTITAQLGRYEKPIGFDIFWDDWDARTDLPDDRTYTTYTYCAGPPRKPSIGILDRPARRLRWFTGPTINEPPSLRGRWEKRGLEGTLHVKGLTPGARYALCWQGSPDPWSEDVAPENGEITATRTFPKGWHSCTVVEQPENGNWADGRRLYMPYPAVEDIEDQRQKLYVTYDWDTVNPWRITANVVAPQAGTYTINWGDDSPVQQVTCDGWVLEGAVHEYPHTSGPYTLTITDPDGVTGTRILGPTTYEAPCRAPSANAAWFVIDEVADEYGPCRASFGDRYGLEQWHPGTKIAGGGARVWWRNTYGSPGRYPVFVTGPFSNIASSVVDITTRSAGESGQDYIAERTPSVGLSATFVPNNQWYGGYTATYRVTNHGTEAANTWKLTFTLQTPSVIKDQWGSATLYNEGLHDGMHHYRIESSGPLNGGQSIDIGFRVEADGQEQAAQPRSCTINGVSCSANFPRPEDDKEPPTAPTDLKIRNVGPRGVSLSWTAATDDTGVRTYDIAVDNEIVKTVPAPATSGVVTGLEPETQYETKVRALDTVGNASLWSESRAFTTKKAAGPGHRWPVRVAPFVDMGMWPTPQLQTFSEESGVLGFNLGFITAPSPSECQAVWAGQKTYAVADGWQRENIAGFRAGGGVPIISFGGESGTELAQAAKDVDQLYEQYKLVLTTYGLDKGPAALDFDIEGAAQKDQPANERRAAVIARLQQEHPELLVSWTLPVLPEGLVADGLNVLRTATQGGVRLDLVNIMSMVFNRPSEDMGVLVRRSMENTHQQLAEFFPGLPAKERWAHLSVCPMIGMNNDRSIFSLENAEDLTNFAIEKQIGQITYWEASRDRNACLSQQELYKCTGIPQEPWDFAVRFSNYEQGS